MMIVDDDLLHLWRLSVDILVVFMTTCIEEAHLVNLFLINALVA